GRRTRARRRRRSTRSAGSQGTGSTVTSFKEADRQPVELVELLQLRPVPAAAEYVQLRAPDQLQRKQGAVERVDPVLPAPDQQHAVAQPVRLPPEQAVLGGGRVEERGTQRGHRSQRGR